MYNVLIIGAGNIASDYDFPKSKYQLTHAHAFSENCNFKLIGFVDKDLKKSLIAAKKWNCNSFNCISDAVSKNDIHVFVIATPDETHFKLLCQVIEYKPKLIVCEKPLTLNYSESLAIKKISNENNVPITLNYKRAFVPEYVSLFKKLKKQEFGKLKYCSLLYNRGLIHNGSHFFDVLNRIVKLEDIQTLSVNDTLNDFSSYDKSISASLKVNNNIILILNAFHGDKYPIYEMDFNFENGRIRFVDAGNEIELYNLDESHIFKGYKSLKLKKVIKTDLKNSMKYMVDNFFNFLSGKEKLIVNIEDSIQIQYILNKINY